MAADKPPSSPARTVCKVQFVAVVPDLNRDRPERIFLATSRDAWAPDSRPLRPVAPGVYSGEFAFEPGQVEYKFTRDGTWDSVEKDEHGGELPNRLADVRTGVDELVLVHRIAAWSDVGLSNRRRVELNHPGGSPRPLESTLTGDVRFHHRFHSPQLLNARTIAVYLPPGYDDRPRERYPVLYMHDGQNLFDARTSFTGVEWGVDETAQRLIESGRIEPLIIVAIYNTPDRIEEYTPTIADLPAGDSPPAGRGDAYLAFLTDTLKPFIDSEYRTRPEAGHTAIGGSSLGGLISLYAVHRRPQVFARAAVVSPSLRWADGVGLVVAARHPLTPGARIWLDMGTREGSPAANEALPDAARACLELTEIWKSQGLQTPRDYHFDLIEDGRHHETDWALRFDKILSYLFGNKDVDETE